MLVPGALVPLMPLGLPEGLRGAAREQVAARQLAEQLAMPADRFEVHPFFAPGGKTWDSALVADATKATEWRQASGRRCEAILPDYMALPTAEGLWSLEVLGPEGTSVRARLGPGDGFSGEVDLAITQLRELTPPKAILRLGSENAALDTFLGGLDVRVLHDAGELKTAGLKTLRWADATSGGNLIEPPRSAADRIADTLRRWRMFAVAAVIAIAAWLGGMWVETDRMRAAKSTAESQTEGMVREHFVPTGPILDVRAQVSAVMNAVPEHIEAPESALTPVQQFQTAAPVLTGNGIVVTVAEHRAGTGLVVSVNATDFTALDAVVIALQDANFLVEQLDARARQSGGVSADLRLELLP